MKFHLYREQKVYNNISEVFAFFENVENLEKITPPWLNFKILSKKPYIVKKNAEFDYSIKILGFRIKWKSIISDYNPPHKFTDIQVNGPYKKWCHTHLFKEFPDHILIVDSVEYELYGKFLAGLVNKIFVQRKLNDIFNYRKLIIQKTFNKKNAEQ